MAVLTLGVSFRRAPLDLLERLAFTDDDLTKAYGLAHDIDGMAETVILSTCNRVEVYANVPGYHAGFMALKRLLLESRGVDADDIAEPLYSHWEQDAADHLFAVTAGLDSMVLGETQIGSQVREAIKRAEREAACGSALTELFHSAIRTGRRVRSETTVGAAPDAFVVLAADLATEALHTDLARASVVVVGAGQMASLAVKHVLGRGAGTVRVLNRSTERARTLAERTGAEHGGLDELPAALASADLIVSATGAAGVLISRQAVRAALIDRENRPLVLIDLAVPRDIEPGTADIEGVTVVDVLSLRERLADHDEATAVEIGRAHEIVAEEVRRFVVRRRSDALAPLIRAIRARGEEIMASEIDRYAGRLSGLDPDERDAVDAVARGIVAKLLHDPIVELKERSEPGTDRVHARLLAELLGIDPNALEE